jgi:hypothetical protein
MPTPSAGADRGPWAAATNWQSPAFNRWAFSFWHGRELLATQRVAGGTDAARTLPEHPRGRVIRVRPDDCWSSGPHEQRRLQGKREMLDQAPGCPGRGRDIPRPYRPAGGWSPGGAQLAGDALRVPSGPPPRTRQHCPVRTRGCPARRARSSCRSPPTEPSVAAHGSARARGKDSATVTAEAFQSRFGGRSEGGRP